MLALALLLSGTTVSAGFHREDDKLLSPVGIVKIPATGKFFAGDHFTASSKTIKFAFSGNEFARFFLDKVEEPQGEVELRVSQLRKLSLDKSILDELGNKAETTLASVWELLKKQPKGEQGTLLTNGYVNIFYVRDSKGVLWAVSFDWVNRRWIVDTYSVEDLTGWGEGYLIFSRHR